MNGYAEVAELIYRRVRRRNDFGLDKSKNLDLIFVELKKVVRRTMLKLKYEFNNINDLNEQISLKGGVKLDLSLAPDWHQDKEFILWLTTVIKNITDEIGINQRGRKPNLKYHEKDNGEAIEAYLNSEEFKQYYNF